MLAELIQLLEAAVPSVDIGCQSKKQSRIKARADRYIHTGTHIHAHRPCNVRSAEEGSVAATGQEGAVAATGQERAIQARQTPWVLDLLRMEQIIKDAA